MIMIDARRLLDSLLGQMSNANTGNIKDVIGNVLKQATDGVRDGARDFNAATGVGDKIGDAAKSATGGKSAADLLQTAKDMIAKNPGMAGAAAAGFGGLLLGTRGGRGMVGSAIKLGGLTLIGGLAYKAWQNYQAGTRPATPAGEITAAPHGTGFAPDDGDDDARALLMVRAMIAAAAADGRIDNMERDRIFGNLRQAGLEDEAADFIEREFKAPLSATALVGLSTSPQSAAQIYTAARLAIDPDTDAEKAFLSVLAKGLKLDADLVAHIDAAASSVISSGNA
jgi:uncharacterized membrane protein YebE (DUF533 family)